MYSSQKYGIIWERSNYQIFKDFATFFNCNTYHLFSTHIKHCHQKHRTTPLTFSPVYPRAPVDPHSTTTYYLAQATCCPAGRTLSLGSSCLNRGREPTELRASWPPGLSSAWGATSWRDVIMYAVRTPIWDETVVFLLWIWKWNLLLNSFNEPIWLLCLTIFIHYFNAILKSAGCPILKPSRGISLVDLSRWSFCKLVTPTRLIRNHGF